MRAARGLHPGPFFKDEIDVNEYPKSETLKNDIIIKRNTTVKSLIATQKPSFNRFLNTLKDSPR